MLQQKLQTVVGEDCVKVDGVYGPRTVRAVKMFMQQQGLARRHSSRAEEMMHDGGGGGDGDGDGGNRSAAGETGLVSSSSLHGSAGGSAGGSSGDGSAAGKKAGSKRMSKDLSPHAQRQLHEAFLSQLEAKALSQAASSAPQQGIVPASFDIDEDVKLLQISLNQVTLPPSCLLPLLPPIECHPSNATHPFCHLSLLPYPCCRYPCCRPPTPLHLLTATLASTYRCCHLQVLAMYGGTPVKPDGVWGPKTRRAIDEFQTQFGLPLGGDLAEQLRTVSTVIKQAAAAEAGGSESDAPAEELGRNGKKQQRWNLL